jgi:hypothetical protein
MTGYNADKMFKKSFYSEMPAEAIKELQEEFEKSMEDAMRKS